MCSLTFTLFWLRKISVTVEIFLLSFRAYACVFPLEISSICGKSFPFPFSYFVLFILRYFLFNVVYKCSMLFLELLYIFIAFFMVMIKSFTWRCCFYPSSIWYLIFRFTNSYSTIKLLWMVAFLPCVHIHLFSSDWY